MTTSIMEAWLAEFEMEQDPTPSLINNPCHQYNQCERIEATLVKQFSNTLGESYLYSLNSNISSPNELDLDNIFVDQFTPSLDIKINSNDNDDERDKIFQKNHENKDDKEVINGDQVARGGAKRKRQPNQVQDHIIAERRRRELISQLFISLSALVPGLKKMDKTSVLGEAIKYMKQLQENVKTLEEVVAKRAMDSVMVIKKSQLVVNDDTDNSSTVDDGCASGCSGGDGGGSSNRELENVNDSLPEIEVKILSNKLLLKIYCENKKGIMVKLFKELEKHDLSVTNCSVVPFESSTLDITIVAQMERGFNMNVRSFLKNIRSAIRLSSR